MREFSILKRSRVSNQVPLLRLFSVLLIVSMLIAPVGVFAAPQAAASSWPLTTKAIFFSSDGMRPDLMEHYAAAGDMPTYASLMAAGVHGDNGMVQAFPPNVMEGALLAEDLSTLSQLKPVSRFHPSLPMTGSSLA